MKTKKLFTKVLVLLLCMVTFTACTKKSFYSDDYAIQENTLVDTKRCECFCNCDYYKISLYQKNSLAKKNLKKKVII